MSTSAAAEGGEVLHLILIWPWPKDCLEHKESAGTRSLEKV
jgi:hypothetical protein